MFYLLKYSYNDKQEKIFMSENKNKFNDEDIHYSESMERAKKVDISKNVHVYTNAEDYYKENMSTAKTFLVFGFLGTVFTALNIFGVLRIMNGMLQMGLSACMFLGFMIYGIVVLRSKKELIERVEKEKQDREKYTVWMKEKFTSEMLSALGSPDSSPEELELLQANFISEELVRHFPEINPNFADTLAEEFLGE